MNVCTCFIHHTNVSICILSECYTICIIIIIIMINSVRLWFVKQHLNVMIHVYILCNFISLLFHIDCIDHYHKRVIHLISWTLLAFIKICTCNTILHIWIYSMLKQLDSIFIFDTLLSTVIAFVYIYCTF